MTDIKDLLKGTGRAAPRVGGGKLAVLQEDENSRNFMNIHDEKLHRAAQQLFAHGLSHFYETPARD
jgi:hypothetical protein